MNHGTIADQHLLTYFAENTDTVGQPVMRTYVRVFALQRSEKSYFYNFERYAPSVFQQIHVAKRSGKR